jgi:hypothetical protein
LAVLHQATIPGFARFGVAVSGSSPRRQIEFYQEQNFMKLEIADLPKLVRDTKKSLRAALPDYAAAFQKVESEMRRRVDAIVKERESGQAVVPNVQVTEYVEENDLDAKLAHAAEDKYFGTLASAKPQIYGIYWSRPQVRARQAESLTRVRVFMNNLWKAESEGRRHFNPNEVPAYADRIRRRPPGSASLGLSPHVDGGSVERWLDENFRRVYRRVFSGDVQQYDAFDAAFRPEVREVPSPAVCSMFRTFQGWTALTRQGKGDGTLQLIPIAESMVYILLRALQDDVGEDDLCGAQPGRALSVNPQFHSLLIEALSSIPLMQPGDAVFWHCDVVHAVENEYRGSGYSNVMYIASAPGCAKNSAYLPQQAQAFLAGKTPPDFAPDDFEVDFVGRGTVADLTELGRSQLGITEALAKGTQVGRSA